jgi:hypothetical protein
MKKTLGKRQQQRGVPQFHRRLLQQVAGGVKDFAIGVASEAKDMVKRAGPRGDAPR